MAVKSAFRKDDSFIEQFLRLESAGGILLIAAAGLAILGYMYLTSLNAVEKPIKTIR